MKKGIRIVIMIFLFVQAENFYAMHFFRKKKKEGDDTTPLIKKQKPKSQYSSKKIFKKCTNIIVSCPKSEEKSTEKYLEFLNYLKDLKNTSDQIDAERQQEIKNKLLHTFILNRTGHQGDRLKGLLQQLLYQGADPLSTVDGEHLLHLAECLQKREIFAVMCKVALDS